MKSIDNNIIENPTLNDLECLYRIESESYPKSEVTETEVFKSVLECLGDDDFYQMKKVSVNGEIAGFYCVVNEDGLCAELVDIAVSKKFRSRGLGTLLLNEAIRSLPKATRLLELSVNERNEQAISLYKKFGFDEVGKERFYYKNGDSALLFSLRLGSN